MHKLNTSSAVYTYIHQDTNACSSAFASKHGPEISDRSTLKS